jgi:succinate-acetate transporter protein
VTTGALRPEFNQALALYLWVWFIITVLYTVAAMRSTWVLFLDLLALSVCLLLLACGFMTGVEGLLTAGYAVGVVVCFLSCEFSLFFFS